MSFEFPFKVDLNFDFEIIFSMNLLKPYLFGCIFKGNLMGNDIIIVELNPKCCFKDSGLQLNCTVPPRGPIKGVLVSCFLA